MSGTRVRDFLGMAGWLALAAGSAGAGQEPAATPQAPVATVSNAPATIPEALKGVGSLRVSLRLENNQRFLGVAEVRLLPHEGEGSKSASTGVDGEALFSDVLPGKYRLEATAPGFVVGELKAEVVPGLRERILYLVMKPKPLEKKAESPAPMATAAGLPGTANSFVAPARPAPAEGLREDFRLFHESAMASMSVDPDVKCPAEKVLKGTGERMREFVSNLEKFSATELVEHYPVNVGREHKQPETRQFAYVVTVWQNSLGTFMLDEYRDGSTDPSKFPAGVATNGLPALDLLFHPVLAGDFQFACEGLGQRNGKAAWQVHFAQRADRRVRIRSYKVGDKTFHVMLEGRAWIDPGNYQVIALESEMQKPILDIQLRKEKIAIEYAPVDFQAQSEQIWLPREAEIYVERNGHRYYRRHTFSDFKVFNVETAQNTQAPKGSYTFVNHSGGDIAGVLTVTPEEGTKQEPVSLRIVVPARAKIFKVVGTGKDVNLPASMVASAKFEHEGSAEAITVEANMLQETTLDVIPELVIPKDR